MRWSILRTLSVLVSTALCVLASAQQNPLPMGLLSSRASVAVRSDASGELELSADQVGKIQAAIQQVGNVNVGAVQAGELPVFGALDDAVKGYLTEDQWKRLQELWIQFEGPFVLQSASISERLEITPDEQKKIQEIVQKYRGWWSREIARVRKSKDLDHLRREGQKTGKKLLDVLTKEQRKKFSELEGPKFKFQT